MKSRERWDLQIFGKDEGIYLEIIIITGMSGAGKTQAMECMEDRGFYCIDNMPPTLIKNFISLAMTTDSRIDKAAFVMDIRGGEIFKGLEKTLDELDAEGLVYNILFLEASDSALIRRFDETRRVHPMTYKAVTAEDLENERKALQPLRERADYIIDTSNMKSAKLKSALLQVFSDDLKGETFVINIMSFGFKHGAPVTADMLFDMRFIPNPYYVKTLKSSTGNSKKVRSYVLKHPEARRFIDSVEKLLEDIIPYYAKEGKWHLNIAFGCTGGQHRSVVMANEFAKKFESQGKQVTLEHRDIRNRGGI